MKIAVLVPCYNEEISIRQVIKDCHRYLPMAEVYVYDNNSQDKTAEIARLAGAHVFFEHHQGKGHVVRRMFADVDADIYVMTDGDATYDIASVPRMIRRLVDENLDMITGVRKIKDDSESTVYRPGHRFGNWLMTHIVHLFFGRQTEDMLSGLRVFSRRFVKSFPANSTGFEIETELTVFASSMHLPQADFETPYYARPVGSQSKLSTFKDGYKILKMIALLIKEERPLLFFGLGALVFFLLSLGAAIPVVMHYWETGLVPRIPTTVLAVGLGLCGGVSLAIALILDTVSKTKKEVRRMHYLSVPLIKE